MDKLSYIEDMNIMFSLPTLHPQVFVGKLMQADSSFFKEKEYNMYILILFENECGNVIRDGNRLKYSKNSLVTIRPGQSLEIHIANNVHPEGWILAFKPELLERTGLGRDFYMFSYFKTDFPEAIVLTNMEYHVIKNCFANINAELHTPKDHLSGQMIRLGIGTLLSYVKRYFENQQTNSTINSEKLVAKLDRLLEKFLISGLAAQQGQPTVSWCAAQLNLTPNYFSDLIKKEINVTTQKYIRDKVIFHAQILLRQTNMTINEIAEELGFVYPNHFTRMFHKATGQTPQQYRKGT